MRNYELTFIINAQLAPEKQEEIITKFLNLLKSRKIEIVNIEKWGKKKLAYPIEDSQYGYYLMTQFRAPVEDIAEIEKFLKLSPEIFRYLILYRSPKTLNLINLESERRAREAMLSARKEQLQEDEHREAPLAEEEVVEEENLIVEDDLEAEKSQDSESAEKE